VYGKLHPEFSVIFGASVIKKIVFFFFLSVSGLVTVLPYTARCEFKYSRW